MATTPKKWTHEQDAILKRLYLSHTREEIAHILGRTKASVRKRCSVLKLNTKHPAITSAEIERIKAWYAKHAASNLEDFNLAELARELGRSKSTISKTASQLGLTRKGRKQGLRVKRIISLKNKARIAEKGHPRGMLGRKHTEEFKRQMSKRVREYAAEATPLETAIRVQKSLKTKIERYGTGRVNWDTSQNPYSRTRSGKRDDLNNQFFRSSWEANYARYLNFLIQQGEVLKWEFEAKTFVFHGVTRGELTYTPDFKVTLPGGVIEWHEVKGWMDAKSKAKLKRMAKFYPDERVVIIGKDEYRAIAKWKGLIDGWEE